MHIQRFPFGLSRLILQYILYSKTRKNHVSIFTLGKPYIQNAQFFLPAPKIVRFERKSRKLPSGKINTATIQKETAVGLRAFRRAGTTRGVLKLGANSVCSSFSAPTAVSENVRE
jgi:hypothetical protein